MHSALDKLFNLSYTKHLIETTELKALVSNPQLLHNTKILDSTLYN